MSIVEKTTTTDAPSVRTLPIRVRRRALPFNTDLLISIGFVVVLLALWQWIITVGILDRRLWPTPTTITMETWRMLQHGQLQPHLLATFTRVLWAFAFGSAAGIALGLAMGMIRPIRAMFDPVISILSVMPKIAILPLVYLAFGGYGETPRIVTVGISVFAVMAINAMGAVQTIDHVLLEAGRNFGANGWQMFRHVLLPGSLPTIFSGLRISAATALLVVIAAEFSYTNEGLGFLIWSSWNTLSTTRMFVGLIAIAMRGLTFTLALNLTDRLLLPWKRPR